MFIQNLKKSIRLFINFFSNWCKTTPTSGPWTEVIKKIVFFLQYKRANFKHTCFITLTQIQLDKWACSDVTVMIRSYEWWAERASYCQLLCISHISLLQGFDPTRAVFIATVCQSCIFFLPLSVSVTLYFVHHLLSFPHPLIHNRSSRFLSPVSFPPWPSCVPRHTLRRTSPPTLCRHVIIS